jgi:hypothetical protein
LIVREEYEKKRGKRRGRISGDGEWRRTQPQWIWSCRRHCIVGLRISIQCQKHISNQILKLEKSAGTLVIFASSWHWEGYCIHNTCLI